MPENLPLGYHFTSTTQQPQEIRKTTPAKTAYILDQIGLPCNSGDEIQLPDSIVQLLGK